jgi:hypothetical protein
MPDTQGIPPSTNHVIFPWIKIAPPALALSSWDWSPSTEFSRPGGVVVSGRFFSDILNHIFNGLTFQKHQEINRCIFLTIVIEDEFNQTGSEISGTLINAAITLEC